MLGFAGYGEGSRVRLELFLFTIACVYVVATAAVIRVWRRRRAERRASETREALGLVGRKIPATLHPVFDPDLCIGSGSCTVACPYGDRVVGLVDGRGALVDPAECVGHGRCAAECPVGAIRLVFGTSERGVDIPHLTPEFETNVPGLYVVGELGGMGLVANAVRQAREGMRNIRGALAADGGGAVGDGEVVDVAIVGAGPAGIAAARCAIELGLSYRVLEKERDLGGAILHYPRQKIVMLQPVELPMGAALLPKTMRKEELLALLQGAVARHALGIEFGAAIEGIAKDGDGAFTLTGAGGIRARARRVVLAIGRRGAPRRLGVPGEELEKVTYGLREPEDYAGRDVLVVGGGDSAAEAACSLADEGGARVILSYRGDALANAKPANRARLEALAAAGRIAVAWKSRVVEIRERSVVLEEDGAAREIPNDDAFVMIGGELPTAMLSRCGVRVERHFGEEVEAHRAVESISVFDRLRGPGARLADFGRRGRRPGLGTAVAVLLGLAAVFGLFWLGRDFYLAPFEARRDDGAFAAFRATGVIGHTLGIWAGVLMIVNISYFVRKELALFKGVGDIRIWMRVHQFSGLLAGAIALLHTGFFALNAFAAALYTSLAIVVATGIVGRYLYGFVPLDPLGRPLAHQALVRLTERLERQHGALFRDLDATVEIRKVLGREPFAPYRPWLLLPRLLFLWPLRRVALGRLVRRARAEVRDTARFFELAAFAREMYGLRLRMELSPQLKRLLGGWRAGHGLLAVLMVFLVAVHITIEIWLGYRWVL